MKAELSRLRSLHGESTVLWAGVHGVRVEPERWIALSGARSVDYNLGLCHGAGIDAIPRTLEEILAAGAPALLAVAGTALGEVGALVTQSWVCVGSVPFMAKRLEEAHPAAPTGSTVRLERKSLDRARVVIGQVFDLDQATARVALPPDALDSAGRAVWAALDSDGTIVSCLVSVAVQDAVVIWSMATRSGARREGYGTRLLDAALADAAVQGSKLALLHSSPQGERFYRSAGFCELERWQLWSRPRWMLGRT